MLNFLLDIAPDKSQLLLTIKLAGILREKKQEVYYTYTSNPAFTPVLYNKGISNCVPVSYTHLTLQTTPYV